MKKRAISYIVAFIVLLSVCAGEESIRGFRAVDPVDLERRVPRGYGQVFVEAGRENNIDPVFLAAISAHESGQWKSRIARRKNNWMGLMSRRGPKSFGTPQESIFYAAKLLNRQPFQGRNTLSEIAPIYCAKTPKYWESSVVRWKHELQECQTAGIERE
jgi:Mannosyl-glycoprotein endo-beta-N-acetylglucosaminidase